MAIFDVDKNSQDRNDPRPNTHDVLQNRPNYGTLSSNYTTEASSSIMASAIKSGFFNIVGSGILDSAAVTTGFTSGQYTSGSASASVAHGLPYIPAFLAYVNFSGSYQQLPYVSVGGGGSTAAWTNISAYTTATDFVLITQCLGFDQSSGIASLPIRYYLLQQTSN